MRVDKVELSRRIDKIKNVVPKNSPTPALMGILVQDGYLIASNQELTVKAKLEGTEGKEFIIPARAFDLIRNLPNGEVEISESKNNRITICMEKIKNTYQSLPAADYLYSSQQITESEGNAVIDSKVLKDSIAHVLYAIPSKGGGNVIMTALCLEATAGKLNFVGLDGHVIAWVQTDFDGEFKILIPRSAVEKLLSLELDGDVQIEYDNYSAIFKTNEYEVHTRLIEGEYFKYESFFNYLPLEIITSRTELLEAVIRAKLCTEELTPTRFKIEGEQLELSIKDKSADYSETLQLKKGIEKDLVMGFNSRLVLETLKSHTGEEIKMYFEGGKKPMIVESSGMRSIVLPVQLKG